MHLGLLRPFVLGFFCSTLLFMVYRFYATGKLPWLWNSFPKPSSDSKYLFECHSKLLLKQNFQNSGSSNLTVIQENKTVADHLFDEVRIFCWVLTTPKNKAKAAAIKATWGQRCSKLVFVSSENDLSLPAVDASVPDGFDHLWKKIEFGFRYSYKTSLNDFDWFLKADDDTFVIMENLRLLLTSYSSKQPVYFGCQYEPYVPREYMSGGAGYVISREALRRFVEDGFEKEVCHKAADGEAGSCLEKIGAKLMGSGMENEASFPFGPKAFMSPGHEDDNWWYTQYLKHPKKDLLDCSDTTISFHYISNYIHMYLLEYLIYHLRAFGLHEAVKDAHFQIGLITELN